MKIKLSWRLTTAFCVIILLVLSIVYIYTTTHLKDYLEQRIQHNLKRDLLLNKNLLENELKGAVDSLNTSALAKRMGESLGIRVTIVSTVGSVTGDSEVSDEELKNIENHITRPEIEGAINNGFGSSKRFSTTKKTNMLYMAAPLGKNGSLGFLRLAIPLSEIELIESKMQKTVGAALVLGFLLTMALGAGISTMISEPLHEMSLIANKMAKGDFTKKIYARSKDEIGDLANALNYMAEEIKDKMKMISNEEAKLDTVISSMFEGIMLTDEKGRILIINPSLRKLFLVDSQPEGKKPIEVLRNNRIQDLVEEIVRGAHRITVEETISLTPEETIVRINGAPVVKNGVIHGAILVFHDITELRRLERMRQDFVANVSHELRTPLSNIKGYSETLLGGAIRDDSNSREFIKTIHDESERLSNIINDLLDISRLESGKVKIALIPVEAGESIKKAATVLKNFAAGKSINIELSIPDDLPKISADEGRFTQALLNLLDNAIKYTPERGSIRINALKEGGFVRIEVTDTGVGIPEKDLPRIFERFYRVDKARSRELGGTGLGLSIVKHIIQAHGGEVWVKSVLGKGSTFSFIVPIA